ncbi:MAG TPA: 50S ribosomal protein L11 methyltransferase [Chloroflexota bacterium]|nr:50S ribosomal protein L11 methyltransferase [Chloroflexota bacterium]
MSVGNLAVVAVRNADATAVEAALRDLSAILLPRRVVRPTHALVYGRFADDDSARHAVADLRTRGWSAAQRPADDSGWIVAWRNRTAPVDVDGGRLTVALPWSEHPRGDGSLVEIDPGAAFGAGGHPTTRLLLQALCDRIRGGDSVLDIGCGSGVLAISAARLGADRAFGIDIDPAAVAATDANAEWNGLADRVTAARAPLAEVTGQFDVVVANIGRDTLIDMAADIDRLLAPGGWLGLSGISPAQISLVGAAFRFVRIVDAPELDEWAAIIAHRA